MMPQTSADFMHISDQRDRRDQLVTGLRNDAECETCGEGLIREFALKDTDGNTFHRRCAAKCAGCDEVFPLTKLVGGFCLECRESDPNE